MIRINIPDKELIEYIIQCETCTNMIFIKECDASRTLQNVKSCLDKIGMESVSKEKYGQMLNLAIRMGLPTMSSIVPISRLKKEEKDHIVVHMALLEEARKRQLNLYDKKVRYKAYDHPETIGQVEKTYNFQNQGDYIWAINQFDYPVRKACTVLFSKGYVPYWSSANKEDTTKKRCGEVINGKNVAYILIDPQNLTDDQKEELLLNGNLSFRKLISEHGDNDKYYGIWEEITSPNMSCDELSRCLFEKAKRLPDLCRKYTPKKIKGTKLY